MASCAVTGGRHIPGCGCAEEPAPRGRAKRTTGPSNVNRQDPNRKTCGYSWETKGAAHTHICGLKPHNSIRTRHVCEHPNCTDSPPRNRKSGSPATTPVPPPGGGGSGPGSGSCYRCGGSKKIPGPKRTWVTCPACGGTGNRK